MPAPTLATLIAESPLDDVLEAIEATARRPDTDARAAILAKRAAEQRSRRASWMVNHWPWPSRYTPHQGAREVERRRKRLAARGEG